MAKYGTKEIRNIALMGHGGSGKTSLAEAMLYMTKGTDRLGKVPDGNTVSDYDAEEIKRGFSLSTTVIPVNYKTFKFNLLDTPGYLDFSGEVLEAVRVTDSVLIVIDAKSGIEVGADLAWEYATEAGVPKAVFVNKYEGSEAHLTEIFNTLHDNYGTSICPVFVPCSKEGKFLNLIDSKVYQYEPEGGKFELSEILPEYQETADKFRDLFNEAIAGTSDELMEKYFEGEEITAEEAKEAVHKGIISGDIVPVFCGSATRLWGIEPLMEIISDSFPRHTAKENEKSESGDDIAIATEGDPSLFIFKTIADPFVGKMSFFKVMSGELKSGVALKNSRDGSEEKIAHIYTMCGKKQTEVDSLACGDIGMTAKLAAASTNDTLSVKGDVTYKKIVFPEAFFRRAVKPKAKGDEDKISSGVTRLLEEDKTLKFINDPATNELVVSGMGDMHLDIVVSKLKSRYGTSVELTEPKIAYRETIRKKVQAEGKHKKQSGGHGQYGHVRIEFAPGEEEGLTFTESVVGGAVPKGYFPAVEKGLLEAMQSGVLAGYPVVSLAANLYDGSYHDVDSNELSFKTAAKLAFKDGIPKAAPVLLEPVGELKVTVPEDMVGDVMGDLNKRRGRVLGMEPVPGKSGVTEVQAEVPQGEMGNYSIDLRAMTQGYGKYTYNFVRYEDVPQQIADKIIAERANREE